MRELTKEEEKIAELEAEFWMDMNGEVSVQESIENAIRGVLDYRDSLRCEWHDFSNPHGMERRLFNFCPDCGKRIETKESK